MACSDVERILIIQISMVGGRGVMRVPNGWINCGERRIEDAYAVGSVRTTTHGFGGINHDDGEDDNAVGQRLVTFDASTEK